MEKFTFLNRQNLEYIEEQFQKFLENPDVVDPQWRHFFEGIEFAKTLERPSLSGKEVGVFNLIRYYRDYGHLKANLDPLKLLKSETSGFDLENFCLETSDLNDTFQMGALVGLPKAKLRDIISHLEGIYCGTVTAQISGCEPKVREWFQKEFEGPSKFICTPEIKKSIFQSLARTESLEKFFHTRFVGTKRFSVEGGDALLPMLETLVESATQAGVKEMVLGMAHRGRINVLANFMGKALDVILGEFEGISVDKTGLDGDVKYHMGYSVDKQTPHGHCHVSLAFNPSHLECVNPVVCGMARAKERVHKDTQHRKKVVPVQIHGDAAFIGQGVVSETLQLSKLQGYSVGGSIHVIINNQIGFTTNPKDSRSTRYSSDMADSIKAPVLLVNGDDVEACVRAMDMAFRFRHEFGQDVVIDLICYRRYGHNEADEPAFTQPLMYKAIKNHPTLLTIYTQKLLGEGTLEKSEAEKILQERMDSLQKTLEETRKKPPEIHNHSFEGLWLGLQPGRLEDFHVPTDTRPKQEHLNQVLRVLTEPPPVPFRLNPKIAKLIEARKKMVETSQLDWAMGELLAYGCLRVEGTPIRISGQDAKRGTFTHRQAVYFDAETGEEHCPLMTLNPTQGEFCIYNSPLSEMAVLGFEYGNSIGDPTFLTIWEAQFGDFANGAQIIIDQFLLAGEQKWARHAGLVLFLPHGFEGQGPEHSSARLERYLQGCAQVNIQVCNPTTPANLFHLLRRQMKRNFRKPLVVMTPKSLLRHPDVISSLRDISEGGFQEVLPDPKMSEPEKIETLILCSGKIYYELAKARAEKNLAHAGLLRVEQLYPFPDWKLAPFLSGCPHLHRVIWCQEEPQNMGGYSFVRPRVDDLLEKLGLGKVDFKYMGRTERASPAVGSPRVHAREQKDIIDQCLSLS